MLRKFVKDLGIYAPSQFLPALTAFITIPILTRLLPPAEYGYWSLATSAASFLVALAVSGYGSAVLRYYPMYKKEKTSTVFFATLSISAATIIVVVGGIGSILLFLFKNFLPAALNQFLPLILMLFVVQSIYSVFITVMRAQKRSGFYTTFQLFMSYGGLGMGLLFVMFLGMRVNGLLWGSIIALLLTLPLLIFLAAEGAGIHPRQFQMVDARQIWDYAWPLTIGNVAMWGLRASDLFIINLFRPEREVGLYSVSYNISSKSIELLVALFLLSVSPLIYNTWETQGQEATENAQRMITRVYLVLCLPAAVGLCVLAIPFVSILAAPEYYEGYKIIGFVVFSSFAWGLSQIAMVGMTIKKKARQLGANQIIAAVTHLGVQLLFVHRFGYIASAVSTLIGYTLLFVLNVLGSKPHLPWRFPFVTLRNTIIASIVMGLITWAVYGISGNEGSASPLFLILSILTALPTYFVSLWLLGEPTENEKDTLFQIWSRFRKPQTESGRRPYG